MRALLQRVTRAEVRVDGVLVGECRPPLDGQGLLVLLGVTHTDTPEVAAALAAKTWGLRILDGEVSAADVAAPVLVVSQFTLYADTRKGRRPSFVQAAPPEVAEPLYDRFVSRLREHSAGPVEEGSFGAMMDVALVNDGPVTVVIDRDAGAGDG